ncbi:MAG: hypothetical protein ACP5E4_01490 [Candidatus Aenigmatarchaeota archaeon]
MIVTEMKPFKAITGSLEKGDNICVVSCDACARKCECGGQKALDDISEKLSCEGFRVSEKHLIGKACGASHVNGRVFGGDTVVVLGCDASVELLKELFPALKIVPALNTIGLGSLGEDGLVTLVKRFD